MKAKATKRPAWPVITAPPLKLRRPLGMHDRVILTVRIVKAILLDVGVIERVAIRRSRKRVPQAAGEGGK
jgi:hypothetical protein